MLDLPEGWRESARRSPLFDAEAPATSVLPRRPSHRNGPVTRVAVDVRLDMGVRYGRLSGDMNAHATPSGAARLGLARPFLQGLCAANVVVAELSRHGRLSRFAMLFARPVNAGQTLELAFHADGFELRDQAGRLVAFGEHRW